MVIECKHTDSVTCKDLDKKVQLAAEELAPNVKRTFRLAGDAHLLVTGNDDEYEQ